MQAFQIGIYALECGLLSRKARTFLEGTEKLFEYDFLSESVRAFPEGISRFLHTENERLDRRCKRFWWVFQTGVHTMEWMCAYADSVLLSSICSDCSRLTRTFSIPLYRSGNNDYDRGFAFRGVRAEPRSAFGLQGLRLFRRAHRSFTPSTPSNA